MASTTTHISSGDIRQGRRASKKICVRRVCFSIMPIQIYSARFRNTLDSSIIMFR